jgi:ABC-type uncharacterized transport system permease subunit
LEGHPITAYGENGALLLQSLTILALVWVYSNGSSVSPLEQAGVMLFAAIYGTFVTTVLEPEQHYLLMASVLPIFISARGSQIISTYQIKHTGAQSIVTTTLNLVGTVVRIMTTIQEVGWDVALLAGYLVSSLLNATMFAQYWLYQTNTKRFLQEITEKKES